MPTAVRRAQSHELASLCRLPRLQKARTGESSGFAFGKKFIRYLRAGANPCSYAWEVCSTAAIRSRAWAAALMTGAPTANRSKLEKSTKWLTAWVAPAGAQGRPCSLNTATIFECIRLYKSKTRGLFTLNSYAMAFDRGFFHHGQPIGHGQCKQQRSGGEHMVCADLLVIQHDDLAGDGHEGAKGGGGFKSKVRPKTGQVPCRVSKTQKTAKKRANCGSFLLKSHDLKTDDSLRQLVVSYSDHPLRYINN